MARRRLDAELVEQGFFADVDSAMRSILAGEVSSTNRKLTSPGEQVKPGIELHVRGRVPYVSRGGLKLEHGLNHFQLTVDGLQCLDVGCSTGGFTDCLLKHGAASVVSVDVGYAQFDWGLRQDGRVELLERTNITELKVPNRKASIDLAVCDVSFTSVLHILDVVIYLLRDGASFLTLVKPQFEAKKSDVAAGGIVRDEAIRQAALERVSAGFEAAGLRVVGSCQSPITGHKGNIEYLLLATKGAAAKDKTCQEQ